MLYKRGRYLARWLSANVMCNDYEVVEWNIKGKFTNPGPGGRATPSKWGL